MPTIVYDDERGKSPLAPQQGEPSQVNPYAGPAIQGADDPGKLGRILGYANKNPVMSDETKIGLVTPPGVTSVVGKLGPVLPKTVPLLGRLGLAAGSQATGALARGEGVEEAGKAAAKSAAAQGTGEVIGAGVKGVRALLPVGPGGLAKYTADREAALLDDLKQTVPALKDAKSLRDAFQSQAMRDAVHKAYEDSLEAVKAAGKGKTINLPQDVADTFGLMGAGAGASAKDLKAISKQLGVRRGENVSSILGLGQNQGTVAVDAAKAAEAMTGRSGDEGYRVIAKALDDAGIGDPAARAAYKTWSGYENFIQRFEGLKTGKLDLVGAQQALNTSKADPLLQRGLADKAATTLMPTGTPIGKSDLRVPGAIVGSAAGLFGGVPGLPHFYSHGGGAIGGALGGYYLGKNMPTFTNVPRSPINPDVSMLLNQYLQGAIQQGYKAVST